MDTKNNLRFLIIALIFGLGTAIAVMAWTNPSEIPPGGGGALYYSGGNVGIGTTGPNQPLDVESSNSASFTGIEITNTDISTRRWALLTSNNAGTYAPSKGFGIRDISGGVTRLVIDTSGNVGIGTLIPGTKLEVAGQIKITGGSPGAGKVLTSDANGLATWGTVGGILPSGTSGQTLRHDGTNWVANSVIFNNGTNVGIGIAAPTIKLAIGDTDTGLQWISDGNLAVYTNNVERMRIDSSGNVGIGTTGPGDKLEVSGNIKLSGYVSITGAQDTSGNLRFSAANPYIYASSYITMPGGLYISGGTLYAASQAQFRGGIHNDTAAYLTISGGTSGYTYFSGSVGIGTTSPGSKLDVQGGATGCSVCAIGWASSFLSTDQGGAIELGNSAGSGNTPFIDFHYGNSTGQDYNVRIINDANGKLTISPAGDATTPTLSFYVQGNVYATAFFYSSDESLKKNIQKIPNALEKIKNLNGVLFNWKDDGRQDIGLIAQDVEKVFPEAVSTDKQNGLKSIEYGHLIAPLIEAVKEQQIEIEKLKSEIEELKQQ